jgi:hypothetical protein
MKLNFLLAFPGIAQKGNSIDTSNRFGLAPSPTN